MLWKPLVEQYGVQIDFAHRTFRWDSEASQKAHVHCVIVGLSCTASETRTIFLPDGTAIAAAHINAYLMDAPDVIIESRTKPLCDVPEMFNGGKPAEGGNLILTEEERDELLKAEPQAAKLLRPYMMGKDFIARKARWCLWLVDVSPTDIRSCRRVMQRVEAVRRFRLASKKAATRAKAETPTLFDEVRPCQTDYLAIPVVSSQRRKYVPMEWLSADIIPGDKLFCMQQATFSHFAVLTSTVHMAWLRAVCGRLKSDYSYSNTIVYNNFPWPDEMGDALEVCAQNILDARALYPDSSLADLYDPLTMPAELRKAHRDNDREVLRLYGLPADATDEQIVAKLFTMYAASWSAGVPPATGAKRN